MMAMFYDDAKQLELIRIDVCNYLCTYVCIFMYVYACAVFCPLGSLVIGSRLDADTTKVTYMHAYIHAYIHTYVYSGGHVH